VILFNLSGHGLIDMPSYEAFIKGDLQNYTVTDEMIAENLAELDK
jgi:tryptophan synthase beta chain